MLFLRAHRHTFPRISTPRGGINFSGGGGGGNSPKGGGGGGGVVKYPVRVTKNLFHFDKRSDGLLFTEKEVAVCPCAYVMLPGERVRRVALSYHTANIRRMVG